MNTSALLLASIIIIIIASYYYYYYYYYKNGNMVSIERFDGLKKIQKTKSQVDALDERELEECSSNDPSFAETCRRYASCCTDSAVGQTGCLCGNSTLKKCRQDYQDCKSGEGYSRGVAMSSIGTTFVGAKAARGDMCQSILDNCCSAGSIVYEKAKKTANDVITEIAGAGYKPVLLENTDGPLCSQVTTVDGCRESCAADPRCHVAYRDDIAGLCELYSDPVLKEKNTNEMLSADGFKLWVRGKGLDAVTVQSPDVFEGFNSGNMVARCLQTNTKDGKDKCIHPVMRDCANIKHQCEKEYSQLLGDSTAKSMCAKNHTACCTTLRNVDLASKFALDGPKWGHLATPNNGNGNGNVSNKPSWQCDISDSVKTIGECRRRCLEDPRCHILDSNMAAFGKLNGGLDLAKMPAAKCVMYGKNHSDRVVYGIGANGEKKKRIIGEVGKGLGRQIIFEPDNLWTRRDIDELDDEI